jgi:hypothetical protein
MPSLEVITIDGTVIEADQFRTEDEGLALLRTPERSGDSSAPPKPETIGFVPFDRLMYVVPEDVVYDVEQFEEIAV